MKFEKLVPETDVLIVGAGLAGLAAADALKGKRGFLLLEARDRVGGRVFASDGVDLGAEFLHGNPRELTHRLKRARLTVEKGRDRHWQARRGEFQGIDDYWSELDEILSRAKKKKRDRSYAAFYRGLPVSLRRSHGQMTTRFVEGFQAALPHLIGETSLAESQESDSSLMARVRGGYGGLVEWLARDLGEDLRCGRRVTSVKWKRGEVLVEARRKKTKEHFRSRSAILTLPLGVLKANTVKLSPFPGRKRQALELVEMGHVARIVFRFETPFWESMPGFVDEGNLRFFHREELVFPICWTWKSFAVPTLTVWTGGPSAMKLRKGEAIPQALADLSKMFGLTRARLKSLLIDVHTHDWSKDPFSRGAYSYTGVGGTAAREELARPLGRTLFFAGEATDTEGEYATVQGALRSGERAAKEVLKLLSNRHPRGRRKRERKFREIV